MFLLNWNTQENQKYEKGDVYKADYDEITTYFQNHPVGYEEAVTVLRAIITLGCLKVSCLESV